MKAAGIVTFATDLENPDFAGIARATGLFSARVEKANELEGALAAAFAYDGPALVDVVTDRQELSLPPKLTLGQIKGFTLFATRTILTGQGNELVELAKTNLRQLEPRIVRSAFEIQSVNRGVYGQDGGVTDAPAYRIWPPIALGVPLLIGVTLTATAGDPFTLLPTAHGSSARFSWSCSASGTAGRSP